jgi:hypothetical protein
LLNSARKSLFTGSNGRARQPPARFREGSDEGDDQGRSGRSSLHKQHRGSSSKPKSSSSSKSGGSKSGSKGGSTSSQQFSKEALAALVKDEVVGDPAVILGDNSKGKKTFSLVQRINRPASERGYVVLR